MKQIFQLVFLLSVFTIITCENLLDNIIGLYQNLATYEYPTNYSNYYDKSFSAQELFGTFDFIIVGAGSAGSVLANRLSEERCWNILLLEAGKNETNTTDVPALAGLLQFTDYNWGYRSTVQTSACLGMKDQKCNYPRGRALGGSSVINYMMYARGNSDDYNTWEKNGNLGWSYNDVLPYFIKSEKSSLTDNVDIAYHGTNGALSVEHVRHFTELGQAFLDANEELGRNILDYNGAQQMGFSKLQSNTKEGRRCSGNKAFINPAINRNNLLVKYDAYVTKILIQGNIAYGVQFVSGTRNFTAYARKEVIISAGAIGSPQLLMLSGIGPRAELEALGIRVIKDLPVGKNLADHLMVTYPVTTNYTDPGLLPLPDMVQQYESGQGFLTTAGNIQSIGFINTQNENASPPNIEQFISCSFNFKDGFLKKGFGYTDEIVDNYFGPLGEMSPLIITVLLHPKSRGSVKLKSKNPFDYPLIDLNFLSHPDDVTSLVAGIKDIIKMANTTSLRKYNVTISHNPIPQCNQEFLSDAYLTCLVHYIATTIYHPTGTCKMGPISDFEAVVDPKLKVYGFKNLRVIDASIIPFPVSGHTNAAAYMIGEKGSDLIKSEWKNLINDLITCLLTVINNFSLQLL